jgi:hypothetical protein
MYEIEHTKHTRDWHTAAFTMDQSKSDRVRQLCSLIQTEKDQEKFLSLVQELNQLLSEEDVPLRPRSSRAADDNKQSPGT